jgi:hypothetical protein
MDGANQEDPGADLIERIGAEIDRRLDARLAALGVAGGATATGIAPGLPADAAPPEATPRPFRQRDVSRSARQSLWLGILIGSAITGIASITQGFRISSELGGAISSSQGFINAPGVILAALAVAWIVLIISYFIHSIAGQLRDRRR